MVCARIFEPFSTAKGVGEGTGLGLSIVDAIVQHWSGDLQVDGTSGAGMRCTIVLPRLPDPSPAARNAASTEWFPVMAKIVVIDDVAGVRRSVVGTLERAGHEVWAADTGREGAAIVREHDPDLVITDILMPDLDGLETLELIRADGRRRPRFLAISGGGSLAGSEKAPKAAAVRADGVLAKPFLDAELATQVSRILEA